MRIGKREIEALKLLENGPLRWPIFVKRLYELRRKKYFDVLALLERLADKRLIELNGYWVQLSVEGAMVLDKNREVGL